MYIKNNNGPRIEPCGTPHVMGRWEDECPLKCTYW